MTTQSPGLATLYPFLYGDAARVSDGLHEALVASTVAKLQTSVALRIRVLTEHRNELMHCAIAVARALGRGATMYCFGNGGSSTDASAVAELFRTKPSPNVRAIALTDDIATTTALANDVGYERALARHLGALARPGDIAVALSTSGNSENVVAALRHARLIGMSTIGFSGDDGGRFAEPGLVDHLFVAPSTSVHRIQEAQAALYHVLWELVGVAEAADEYERAR